MTTDYTDGTEEKAMSETGTNGVAGCGGSGVVPEWVRDVLQYSAPRTLYPGNEAVQGLPCLDSNRAASALAGLIVWCGDNELSSKDLARYEYVLAEKVGTAAYPRLQGRKPSHLGEDGIRELMTDDDSRGLEIGRNRFRIARLWVVCWRIWREMVRSRPKSAREILYGAEG